MPPLAGLLVVDLTRYLPGAYAGRELLRLGARVARIEAPEGEPLRTTAPEWDDALNAGKESVVCDLKSEGGLELARALLTRADVVLEGFRPGVAARLGVGPEDARAEAVYCSITASAWTAGTSSAQGTTSPISAGPAPSPTLLRRCRRSRSPTWRPEGSARSRRSSPRSSQAAALRSRFP